MNIRSCFAIGALVSIIPCAASIASQQSVLSSLPITSPAGERTGEDIAMLDVTGIPSMDTLGSPNNRIVYLWVGEFNFVTGVGWDVALQTTAPGSRRSDISLLMTNTAMQPVPNFGIAPGIQDRTPGGPTQYSSNGIRKFADSNLPNILALSDGLIRLEFWDTPDHLIGQPDGLWVSGSLHFQTMFPIPPIVAPGAINLLGVGAIVFWKRSRR